LNCSGNEISLDVSECTALESLNCSGNQLTVLDISGCTALESLNCSGNQLTVLDVSGCTALHELDCGSNQLTASALNTVLTALPNHTGEPYYGTIYIYNNSGAGTCNKAIAQNKGWGIAWL
jgi:Leucine-rich repeat (LRR) protein